MILNYISVMFSHLLNSWAVSALSHCSLLAVPQVRMVIVEVSCIQQIVTFLSWYFYTLPLFNFKEKSGPFVPDSLAKSRMPVYVL